MTPEEIINKRCLLGLSRAAFARKLGVSKRTVEGWESGRIPSRTAILCIRQLLRDAKRIADAKARQSAVAR